MAKIIRYLPELESDEQLYVARLITDMSEEQAELFAQVYRERRKDPNITLMAALLGFLVIAGVHRFYLDQVGMGLLYLFTGGFCLIGTLVDIVNHKRLTLRYNCRQADDVAVLIQGALPERRPPRDP